MAKALKAFVCFVFLLVAAGNAYFAIDFALNKSASILGSIFVVGFGLAMLALMGLFAFGAMKASSIELQLHARILARLGFSTAKTIHADEFDRLVRVEESIDREISERKHEETG